jgi:hypothetical protein
MFSLDGGKHGGVGIYNSGDSQGSFGVFSKPRTYLFAGTASGGSTSTIVDSGETWSLAGSPTILETYDAVWITSGAASGTYRKISNVNTGTNTITLDTCSGNCLLPGAGVADTDTYRIVDLGTMEPSAQIISRELLPSRTATITGLRIDSAQNNNTVDNDAGGVVGLEVTSGLRTNSNNKLAAGTATPGTGSVIGADIVVDMTSTSALSDANEQIGIRIGAGYSGGTGSATQYGAQYGIKIRDMTALGTNKKISDTYGIYVGDMRGISNNGGAHAIRVASQTCPNEAGSFCAVNAGYAGFSGGLDMAGGAWNTGHISLGNNGGLHIFRQTTTNRMRVTSGGWPTASTSGDAVVTGSSANTYGPAFWATISAADTGCTAQDGAVDATPSCGREVCNNVDLTCVDVRDMAAMGTTIACDTEGAITALVMCK